MEAVYNLKHYPANFNFFEFLVAAKTRGATHINFKSVEARHKYSAEDQKRRVASILLPGPALAGCTHSEGDKGFDPGYHMSAVLDAYEEFGRIEKLKSVLPPKDVRYTVTLRNMDRYKERNSNTPAWRRFADEIGAVVIEDYCDKPIDLWERMALYAGAEMNFGVANGPMTICWLSDVPHTTFMHSINKEYHRAHGWPVGSRLPWQNDAQHLIWTEDNYENIRSVSRELGIGY